MLLSEQNTDLHLPPSLCNAPITLNAELELHMLLWSQCCRESIRSLSLDLSLLLELPVLILPKQRQSQLR